MENMESIIDKLEKERPSFHDDGKGGLTSWNSNTSLLRATERSLSPGMRTIELGSGYSTVMFLRNGCRHTSISPVRAESERISAYCRDAGISLDNAEFRVGESYDFLPGMPRESFDLIFIDGAHRFPFPIVDWFFCVMLLKKGGLIVIDDTDIISCHITLSFMMNDSHWQPVDVRENFGIFRKKGGHDYPFDWQGQPFSKKKIAKAEDILNAFYPVGNAGQEDYGSAIRNLEAVVRGKESRIVELEAEAKIRNSRIGELETEVKIRELRIGELETEVKIRNSRIGELETEVKIQELRIGELEKDLRDRNLSLETIYNSRGWKALLVYYKIRDKIFPSGSM